MIVKETISGLRTCLDDTPLHPLGFVPTMGALHEGHLSLVIRAVSQCPLVSVSIFVNPTQFNDPADLGRYPRTLEKDLDMLATVLRPGDSVFIPSTAEIYPEEDRRVFDFGMLDKVMEGEHRPGHFNGVAQVVSRLFDIVAPDIAYFGRKDFQQVAIIRELVRQSGSRVKIETCPTVREADGLAMSSRNTLLPPFQRSRASIIYHSLAEAARICAAENIDSARGYFKNRVEAVEGFRLQYFEVVDDRDLRILNDKRQTVKGVAYTICVAVFAGETRLIDNIPLVLS